MPRWKRDQYMDASGAWRMPNDNYIDYSGAWRSPDDYYVDITGAWHWNKKYWNQIAISRNTVPDSLIRHLIDHSYDEVVRKLPLKVRKELEL